MSDTRTTLGDLIEMLEGMYEDLDERDNRCEYDPEHANLMLRYLIRINIKIATLLLNERAVRPLAKVD